MRRVVEWCVAAVQRKSAAAAGVAMAVRAARRARRRLTPGPTRRPSAPKVCDRGAAIAVLGQDVVGVLAAQRRMGAGRPASCPRTERHAETGISPSRVDDAPDRRPGRGLGVVEHLVHGVHGRAGRRLLQQLQQRLAVVPAMASPTRCSSSTRCFTRSMLVAKRGSRPCRRGRGATAAGARAVVGAAMNTTGVTAGKLRYGDSDGCASRGPSERCGEQEPSAWKFSSPSAVSSSEPSTRWPRRCGRAAAGAEHAERAQDARRQIEERDAAADGCAAGLPGDRHMPLNACMSAS